MKNIFKNHPILIIDFWQEYQHQCRSLNISFTSLQVEQWIPKTLPIRDKATRFPPHMTTHYQSNSGILTNNDSESNNHRFQKKVGNHPNLPTLIGELRAENTLIEIEWMRRDQATSRPTQRREHRERMEKRQQWEEDVTARLSRGFPPEEILETIDTMLSINRETKKKKKYTESFPDRGRGRARGRGRGRGRARGPVRAEANVRQRN